VASPVASASVLLRTLALFVLVAVASARAGAPTAFPENAVEFRAGWSGAAAIAAGADVLVPVRFVDGAIGAEVALGLDGRFAARLSATALLFPTLGTTPPLALAVGTDVTWRDDAVRTHVGPVLGLDLLYVSDLPAVIDLYLAPGYAFGRGFSFAWSAEARYYVDAVAWVVASSDVAPVSLGVRVPF
jgi:hypothetical protein